MYIYECGPVFQFIFLLSLFLILNFVKCTLYSIQEEWTNIFIDFLWLSSFLVLKKMFWFCNINVTLCLKTLLLLHLASMLFQNKKLFLRASLVPQNFCISTHICKICSDNCADHNFFPIIQGHSVNLCFPSSLFLGPNYAPNPGEMDFKFDQL